MLNNMPVSPAPDWIMRHSPMRAGTGVPEMMRTLFPICCEHVSQMPLCFDRMGLTCAFPDSSRRQPGVALAPGTTRIPGTFARISLVSASRSATIAPGKCDRGRDVPKKKELMLARPARSPTLITPHPSLAGGSGMDRTPMTGVPGRHGHQACPTSCQLNEAGTIKSTTTSLAFRWIPECEKGNSELTGRGGWYASPPN